MNYTQNDKIEQVTESTLVLGVDIGSMEHYARAFDWRGRELTKKVFKFSTDINGFNCFRFTQVCLKHEKTEAIIGCEPTGHYWFTFHQFVKEHGMKLEFVNPASVKKAKKLDDNSPKKTDFKDPKTIAKFVVEGRYSFLYVPEEIYAELREMVSSRDRILKEQNAAANRIQRWLKIYFPEYLTVYKDFNTVTGMMLLEVAPLPQSVGLVTVAGFELVENSSGKHKGQTTISKRDRKKLRKILYQVVLPLIRSNKEFRNVYEYYRYRIKNPLMGRQAMIAVGCKLIRVFFAILIKGVMYDSMKLIADIHRPTELHR